MSRVSVLTIIFLLFCYNSNANAEPTVSGTTISWPADGWYQVQRADNYQTICSGTLFCIVEPGTYNVINHSKLERYESIVVGRATNNNDTQSVVTVDGDTIRYPLDGWYQVQNAKTYASICSGALFCKVEPGTYNVINHTLGTRYNNIVVEGPEVIEPSVVSVVGLEIQWTVNGWYQVQRADTYQTVCFGFSFCTVPPGVYNVINLFTRTRYEGIEVLEPSTAVTGVEALLTSVGVGSPLAIENAKTFLPVLMQLANATLMRETLQNIWPVNEEAVDAFNGDFATRFFTLSISNNKVTYACPDGGTYSLDPSVNPTDTSEEFYGVFNECSVDDAILNGDVLTRQYKNADESDFQLRVIDSRSVRGMGVARPLTYTYPSGVVVTTSGYNEVSEQQYFSEYLFGSQVPSTKIVQDDKSLTIIDLYDSIAELKLATDSEPAHSSFTANFSFSGTLSNDRIIDVNTSVPFTNKLGEDYSNSNYDIGQIVASDRSGGEMSVSVDPAGGGVVVRVDTDGVTDEFSVPWSDTVNLIKAR